MGTNKKVTEFLKECMADALIKLMKNKPVEKITAGEITQMAGVGRATWFRNFSSKQEAISFKIIQLWNRWADEHEIKVRNQYTTDNAKDFFDFNYSIRNLLDSIYIAGMQSALFNSFYEVMSPQYGANVEECYKSRFYSYGLFGLLDEWIKHGYHETPEEMTKLFMSGINK